MTPDIRTLLRDAADTEPSALGVQAAMDRGLRLRWVRRVQVVVPLAIALVVALVLTLPRVGYFIDAERISPAQPVQRGNAPGDPTPTPRASIQPSEARRPAPVAPRGDDRDPTVSAGTHAVANCDPVISDFSHDASDPSDASIDILTSTIDHDAKTDELVFRHQIRDITEPPAAGTYHYDLHFTWDDLEYSAEAWIDTTGRRKYAIVRRTRTYPQGVPDAVNYVELGTPTGSIDTRTDIVTLRVSLDEFNDGERTASANEGKRPPRRLERGSVLTQIGLYTLSSMQGNRDVGPSSCDFVI